MFKFLKERVSKNEFLRYTRNTCTVFIMLTIAVIVAFLVFNFIGKSTSSFNSACVKIIGFSACTVCLGLFKSLFANISKMKSNDGNVKTTVSLKKASKERKNECSDDIK